ncbi:c-type cytochrome [Aegicerativicinus sediminis]|uniref:c-type cytochrome n=1 Tax=Aegicerativicinus sediminis TaxID=2893202 RepID=UPI001E4B49FC|nr:c-type cytochrome [Aegicerativicinus sediminis]
MSTKILMPILFGIFLFSCNSGQEKNNELIDKPEEEPINLVERGEYLVDLGGCHHCHSPKVLSEKGPIPDSQRLLSGHPADEALPPYDEETAKGYALFSMGFTSFTGPWGTSFAANLTPDDTGIGSWSEEQFFMAMRKGKYKGLENSRLLLPPMPWEDFAKMTDDDLKAIFAYLKSQKPIENVVPAAIPPKM